MTTLKLPYYTTENLTPMIKQYSNVVRYSYNRLMKNKSEKEVRLMCKSLNNINFLNTWLIDCAIEDARTIKRQSKNNKIIFGGRRSFINLLKNKITKEEFNTNRLRPINIKGEKLKQGNRSFKLDIIENNQIIFKFNRNNHIEFKLPRLRKNIKKLLYKLQKLNEVKQKEIGYVYSIIFDLKYIYISFEEIKEKENQLNKYNCLGIDINPDNIGISILNNNNVIHIQEFSLNPIFSEIFNKKLSSDSDKMKYYQNKLKFETFEISKSISNLAKYYKCETVYIENLQFNQSISNKYNNIKNRKINNLWKRELFINNLAKRLNIFNIKLYFVHPAYSSFIGNMKYDYTDAINASIEIARRGYEYRILKNKNKFYPSFEVKHQWKEMATSFSDWKEFYLEIKKSKLKYRVSLNECPHSFRVFQQNSTHKSMVLNYVFMIR